MRKSGVLIALILIFSVFTLTVQIQPVKAQQEGEITAKPLRFSQFGIVEVRVNDPDLAVGVPSVEANGKPLTMKRLGSLSTEFVGYIRVWSWHDVNANGRWDVNEPIVKDLDNDGVYNPTVDKIVNGTLSGGETLTSIIPQNPPVTVTYGDILTVDVEHGEPINIVYHETAPPRDLTVTVYYMKTTGVISLDRAIYPEKGKVYITVVDSDLNEDPTSVQSWTVYFPPLNKPILSFAVNQTITHPSITLTEEGTCSSTFNAEMVDLEPLHVEAPETLTANYTDYSIPGVEVPNPKNYRIVSVGAVVLTFTGKVSFDKETYKIGETATVTVEDPDLNLDSQKIETTPPAGPCSLWVSSTSDPAGFPLTLVETGTDTGIFEGNFTFSFETTVTDLRILKVFSGDYLYANYTDEKNEAGVENYLVTDVSTFKTFTASVNLDKDTYGPEHLATLTVVDPDENFDPYMPNIMPYTTLKANVHTVLDGVPTDRRGITLVETGNNTDIFEGKFIVDPYGWKNASTPHVYAPFNTTKAITVICVYNEAIDEFGGPRIHEVSARCRTYRGVVSLDRGSYSPGRNPSTPSPCIVPEMGSIVEITVTDPDLNRNPHTPDIYRETEHLLKLDVQNQTGFSRLGYPVWLNLTETDVDTGIFKVRHRLNENVVKDDRINVYYMDEFDETGKNATITASALILTHTGVLSVDKSVVHPGGTIIVTLKDEDWNINPSIRDIIPAVTAEAWGGVDVWTTTSGRENKVPIQLVETGPNTGEFKAEIVLGVTIPASPGDLVTITYYDEQNAVGRRVKTVQTVEVASSTAKVLLNKEIYSLNELVTVTIIDPDRNEDPNFVETIRADEVYIKSTSQYVEVNLAKPLVETGPNTGTFTGTFQLKALPKTPTYQAGVCYVQQDDGLTVTYIDPKTAEGKANVPIVASATVKQVTAKLEFDQAGYRYNDTATLTLIDPETNKDPNVIESLEIPITSDTNPAGLRITLTETEPNSGVFVGEVRFVEKEIGGSALLVRIGDTVKAKFVDETPAPEDVPGYVPGTPIKAVEVVATARIGLAMGELPFEVSPPEFLDLEGKPIGKITVGIPVLISSNITNKATFNIDMLYIVQIKDAEGRVVNLNFVEGTVPAKKSYLLSIAWTPEKEGVYKVEVYTWRSWVEPVALSKVVTASMIVFPV
ncbi:hypothetical protein CW703_06435 [Candidatus Bathyarchaeota archaeon]|nr:MAG: hypothetical protein CW703_06435 [Candidatus Bathyarchaeota archaeon]